MRVFFIWSLFATAALLCSAQQPSSKLSPTDEQSKQNLVLERQKALYSALGRGVPILVGFLTLAGAIWTANRTAKAQAVNKAAELALLGEGPSEVQNRAFLIKEFYGDLLPNNFVERVQAIDVNKVGRILTQAPWVAELKREIVKVLAEHPDQRQQIITDYRRLYPQYREMWESLEK